MNKYFLTKKIYRIYIVQTNKLYSFYFDHLYSYKRNGVTVVLQKGGKQSGQVYKDPIIVIRFFFVPIKRSQNLAITVKMKISGLFFMNR